MNNIKKRFILYIFGCILIRLIIVYIAKNINKLYLPYLGILSLIPAIGFVIIYVGNYRKYGRETFGNKIWWNSLRPIHGMLYILFCLLALNKNKYSWIVLLIDIIIGFIGFIIYHYKNNNLKKILF